MYEAIRNQLGEVICIQSAGQQIPMSIDNLQYREFLDWNAIQENPVDLSKHEPAPVSKQGQAVYNAVKHIKDNWTDLSANKTVLNQTLKALAILLKSELAE